MVASFRTEPILCWHCGAAHDGQLNTTGDGGPEPGDLSICIRCGALGFFSDDMTIVRAPTNDEWVELTRDPAVITNLRMMATVRGVLEKRDRPNAS